MTDTTLLRRYLLAAADYHERTPAGLVYLAPQTADRFLLPRCMWPAEARHMAYTLTEEAA